MRAFVVPVTISPDFFIFVSDENKVDAQEIKKCLERDIERVLRKDYRVKSTFMGESPVGVVMAKDLSINACAPIQITLDEWINEALSRFGLPIDKFVSMMEWRIESAKHQQGAEQVKNDAKATMDNLWPSSFIDNLRKGPGPQPKLPTAILREELLRQYLEIKAIVDAFFADQGEPEGGEQS